MGPQQLAKEGPIEPEFVDELKPGTQLLNGQYTISRFLNSGGFGITYVARNSLNREVVIKECFPGAFCRRSNAIVAARSRAHQSEFRSIVRLFVQEAHNLARLVHPNIVGVHQVFEDNDTAYMAIDYIHGSDLLDVIETASVKMTPSSIVVMTRKLLNAVAFIHENGILHRDISPDNILIDQTGEPILIDFGAAREEASRASRALSALRVVKDGYSPQELYIAGSEQGPWSDLYALGASVYHAIAGMAPVNSQARLAAIVEGREDPHLPLAGRFAHYPEGFLEAIDMAMNSLPRKRIQSARDWLAMLDHRPIQTNTQNIDSLVTAMVAADIASKEHDTVKSAEPSVTAAEPPLPRKKMPPANDWSILLDPPPSQTDPEQTESPTADMTAASLAGEQEDTTEAAEMPFAEAGPAAAQKRMQPANDWSVLLDPLSDQTNSERAHSAVTAPVAADFASKVEGEMVRPVKPLIKDTVNPLPRKRIPSGNDWLARLDYRAGQTNIEHIDSLVTALVAADLAGKEEEEKAAAPTDSPTTAAPFAFAANSRARVLLGAATSLALVLGSVFYMNFGGVGDWVSQAQVAATIRANAPVNLLDLAMWDVDVPFTAKFGMKDGEAVATVTDLRTDVDLKPYGSWLEEGAEILSVNDDPVTAEQGVAALMLKGFKETPDGMTQAAVQIKDPSSAGYKRVELALPAVRRIGLFGAVALESRFVDGKWETSVTGLRDGFASDFQVGDIITGEVASQTQFTTAKSLEDSMKALSAKGITSIVFDVLRAGKAQQVTIDLAAHG